MTASGGSSPSIFTTPRTVPVGPEYFVMRFGFRTLRISASGIGIPIGGGSGYTTALAALEETSDGVGEADVVVVAAGSSLHPSARTIATSARRRMAQPAPMAALIAISSDLE